MIKKIKRITSMFLVITIMASMLFAFPAYAETAIPETVQVKPTKDLNWGVSDTSKAYDTVINYKTTYGTWSYGDRAALYGMSLDIPADAVITNIAVSVTGRRNGFNNSTITVAVSNDGGDSFSGHTDLSYINETAAKTHGGMWNLQWTPAQLNAVNNFVIQISTKNNTTRVYDISVTVTYMRNHYSVVWKNGEETLESDTAVYGASPSYDGADPSKANTDEFTYVFAGWSDEADGEVIDTLPTVTGNAVYYAVFSTGTNSYTVTWKNGEETLESDTALYGSAPSFNGIAPVIPASVQYSYTLAGWSATDGGPILSVLPAVTGNVIYYAKFTVQLRTYTVTWLNHDGTLLSESEFSYGDTPVYNGVTPVKAKSGNESYVFAGWGTNPNGLIVPLPAVTGNTTYYAVFDTVSHPVLNISDHKTYILGYPDGTLRPDNYITREEAAMLLYRLMSAESIGIFHSNVNPFTDTDNERWSNTAISTLYHAGLIKGNPDGSFRPANKITRAEAITLASYFAGHSLNLAASFNDIAGHWAQSAIKLAAKNGLAVGYTDGSFRPDHYITRAEIIALFNRVLGRKVSQVSDMLPGMKIWPDNTDETVWYYFDIQEATNAHLYERISGNTEKWTEIR